MTKTYRLPEETRRKMSLAKKGRKFSPEHKAALSAAQTRRHEEHKAKLALLEKLLAEQTTN